MKYIICFLALLLICFSEIILSQTIKWSSTPYISSGDLTVGWIKVGNNPLELGYYQWDQNSGRFMMMDGALSNTIKFELVFDYTYHAYFKNDVNTYSGSDVDYDGDRLNDLVFDKSGTIIIISLSSGKPLIELVDSQYYYGIKNIFDIDGDGKVDIAIQRTTISDGTKVTQVYTTNGDASAPCSVNDQALPNYFDLKQNYPNPFNPTTNIEYELQISASPVIRIYNSLGQQIRTIVDDFIPPGTYTIQWDGNTEEGSAVSTGVYYYQMQVGEFFSSKKMILIK